MKGVDKTIVKDGVNKATAEFSERIKPLNFVRTKKWFWVREHNEYADFIHIHVDGSSYGGPINYSISFRVHFGTRYYSDPFESLALNGPKSDDPEFREKRYHMRFNAKSGSTYNRCVDDLEKFVINEGEGWFKKGAICDPIGKGSSPSNEAASRKLLGLKGPTA